VTGPPVGGVDSFTKLLLHFDGANGSTAVQTDSSGSGHNSTPYGGAQLTTNFARFGSASMSFSGGYCYGDGSADFAFGSGDWTFDCWIRPTAGTATIADFRSVNTQVAPSFYINPSTLVLFMQSGTSQVITGTTAVQLNKWSHFAACRASGVTRMFLNGVQEGSSYTDGNVYVIGASRPLIGIGFDGGTWPFSGCIDEVRVSKGIAKFTSNFTPPIGPYG
jgi:hypothetical protein